MQYTSIATGIHINIEAFQSFYIFITCDKTFTGLPETPVHKLTMTAKFLKTFFY